MLTFQILDGGETYYRPLEDRALTIGSGSTADIQLTEEGVHGLHARVLPLEAVEAVEAAEGKPRYKIEALETGATLLVNGQSVSEASLALGDRIELGCAVLVLGQQVRRPATAADVVSLGSGRRLPFHPDRRSPATKLMYVLVIVIGLSLAGLFYHLGQDTAYLPSFERGEVHRYRTLGQFTKAEIVLRQLETGWAACDAKRQAIVGEARSRVRATAEAYEKLCQRFEQEVLSTSTMQQHKELLRLRSSEQGAESEAARILDADLEDFRIRATELALAKKAAEPSGETGKQTAEPKGRESLPRPEWLDARLEELRRLGDEGQFVQALELINQLLPEVPAEHAEPLRDLFSTVRQQTRAAMDEVVERAYALRQEGKLSAAVQVMRAEVMRFPSHGNLSLFWRELESLEAELALPRQKLVARPRPAAAPAARPARPARPAKPEGPERPEGKEGIDPTEPPPENPSAISVQRDILSETLVKVRDAENRGELELAASTLKDAAVTMEAARPRLAEMLAARAKDLGLVISLSKLAEKRQGELVGHGLKLADGREATLQAIFRHKLRFKIGAVGGNDVEAQAISWLDLPPGSVASLLAPLGLPPADMLGVAVLAYRSGESKAAEKLLVKLLRRDSSLKTRVDGIISRGRGEYVDEKGYDLVEGEFVARRFIRVRKLARRYEQKIALLADKSNEERENFVASIQESEESGAEDALVLALRDKQKALVARIEKHSFRRAYDKVLERRLVLDKARRHALELIYDTVKYFYPFRPPAVSGDRASEYHKVQKEVDRRVAQVAQIWKNDRAKAPVPKAFLRDLRFLRWISRTLEDMGEIPGPGMDRIAWVKTIPKVAVLSVRNFCLTAQESERLQFHMRIEELNEALAEKLTSGERTESEITNSYRMMMGRRPLALNPKLHASAHGHAKEMSTLGYFSHTSPTPGRETAWRRMQLEGYKYGVSENIAKNPSAEGAHIAWLHSSGHHRNLLSAGHTEFAVGNTGIYWVQNFGRGLEFEEHEDFPPPAGDR